MKRRNFAHRPGCAVEATLDLIDGKWKGVILFHLQAGTQRFGELRRRMPGITQRMLTKQLRALEDDKLVIRKVYAEVPPRVEYRLSEIGESLRPVIDTLRAWGEDHLVADAALLVTELATNAVRHASSPFRASVSRTGAAVRIAVEDLGTGEPRLRPADPERLGGRGVALVDAMSVTWGVDPAPAGKVVWCELRTAAPLAV
jgi:DNA-binding HxlR family transcriptional regulator